MGDGIHTKLPRLPLIKNFTIDDFNDLKLGDKVLFKRDHLPEGGSGWFIGTVVAKIIDTQYEYHLVRILSERFKLTEKAYNTIKKYDPEFVAKYAGKTRRI